MGNWTGPTRYPAAALPTRRRPVTTIAASGATWRQSSPDAAATARRSARTPPGRYGGSAGSASTHAADATATAPASHTSARAGAHGRRCSVERPVTAGNDTSHRASGPRRDATPAGVVPATSREGAARPGRGRCGFRKTLAGGRTSTRPRLVDGVGSTATWSPTRLRQSAAMSVPASVPGTDREPLEGPMSLTEQKTIGRPRKQPSSRPGRRRRQVAFGFLTLSAVAVIVFSVTPSLVSSSYNLVPYYADRPDVVHVAFYLHVVFAGLALLLSPLQIAARLRARAPRLHRAVGRIVLGCIAVAGCAALVMAPFNTAGPVGAVGIGITALVWLFCAAAALRAIRRRDVAAHRSWAVRTFALTYTAVTLRVGTLTVMGLLVALFGMDADVAHTRAYTAFLLLAWAIDLAVAECYLVTRHRRTGADTGVRLRTPPDRPRSRHQAERRTDHDIPLTR